MQAGTKVIQTGYVPRPLQADLHRNVKRFNVIVCHRRFGKTLWTINHELDRTLRVPLPYPQYAYIAPIRDQAKRVAWEYFKRYALVIPGSEANEAELRIDIPRPDKKDFCRFMLLGAENYIALKGIYLDRSTLDEYATMHPAAWREAIRPALSDRKGSATFIGTPKGHNNFWELYDAAMFGFKQDDGTRVMDPEWYHAMYRASQTGYVEAGELKSAKSQMSEEEYEQEYECSFSAGIVGAYYTKDLARAENDKRIGDVPYDPALGVITAWDLGIGDSNAIWFFQRLGPSVHAIDFIEGSGVGLDYYVRELQKKPYAYEQHLLPHDAAAKDLSTGQTRQQTLRSLGLSRLKILPKLAVEDRINAARRMIGRTYFDKARCAKGIECLYNYQREWKEKNKTFATSPLHNWASHGADAFGYGALGMTEMTEERRKQLPRESVHDYNMFTHRTGGYE